jgi:hypothetical protein
MTLYAFDAADPPKDKYGNDVAASVYKAAGGIAANVYVSGKFAQTPAHVARLRAGGIGPWPNYEVGLWELVSNRSAGQGAARQGIGDAIRCGFPANGTIWFPFSVDVSVPPSRYGEVGEAFKGINDVNDGRFIIACYGQGGLIDYLHAKGLTQGKGWLSGSSSFPGFNPASPNVCLVQEVGSPVPSTDRNIITDAKALHAWWPAGSTYASGGLSMSDVQTILTAIADLRTQIVEGSDPQHMVNLTNIRGHVLAIEAAVGGVPTNAELATALGALPGQDTAKLAALLTPVIQQAVSAHPAGTPDAVALATAIASHLTLTAH